MKLLAPALILVAIALGACAPQEPALIACTEDAKVCPDGSTVGRVPPDCEFAACPGDDEPAAQSTFRQYINQDVDECSLIRYMCAEGEAFSDETGCGCVVSHKDAAVTQCPADDDPVCGWSDPAKIQCFAYPCAQTYTNLCNAAVDPTVAYTTPGQCPNQLPEDGQGDVAQGDDFRKYVSDDPAECQTLLFMCVEERVPFFDETGCGCELQETSEP